jgi:hypothetical protein
MKQCTGNESLPALPTLKFIHTLLLEFCNIDRAANIDSASDYSHHLNVRLKHLYTF